ncbi:hypothetical protein [Streptomyces acidiscabies]|uniref:hypothetical protein n=1 Tax=Streptomyces acidiscabies TaxID=42234 RepID=UPI00067CA0EE|nr:hypothetical protein [Streptomyces acidiscabies]
MITIEKFSSDRIFVVRQYSVANHGGLLLRSSREVEDGTRIDLHVGSVSAMFLYPSYEGLTINEGTEEDRNLVVSLLGPGVFDLGEKLHVIGEGAMTGFIAGGPLQCREVCAGDDDPSGFPHMPPTD